MPSNRQQAFIDIGLGAIPVATSVISLTLEAEAVPAFFAIAAGVGAGLSLAAAPALIMAAVAAAVVDDKTLSEIKTSVGLLGKATSPGFVFSVPFGAAVTPQDPTLFASAVGPGLDLLAGAFSPSGFDQFQTAQQSFIGFGTWFSDMQKLAASGSAKPSASAAPSGASRESSGYSSADLSSSDFPASGDWNSGGFPYDSATPGGNETPDFAGTSSAPDQSWELDLQGDIPIGGIETGMGSEPGEGESSQNDSAEAGPYSDQESQAAEEAADQASGSDREDDRDDDNDGDDDRDED